MVFRCGHAVRIICGLIYRNAVIADKDDEQVSASKKRAPEEALKPVYRSL